MYRHMFIIFSIIIGLQIMFYKNTYTRDFALTDISGHWAEQKIRNLVNEGVIIGYPDLTFQPDTPITRAEVAMILSHLNQSKEQSGNPSEAVIRNYTDMNAIPDWAKKAIADVTEAYTMNGYLDETFRPTHYISRKEAIQIVSVITHKDPSEVSSNLVKLNSSPFITRAEFCTFVVDNKMNV